MEREQRAAELVGPALHLEVDRRAAGQPLIGVEAARHDADGFDRLEPGHVRRHVRQPDVRRRRPFDAHGVRVPRRAVHVELQRARRVGGDRVRVRRRREAWNGDEEVLIVAVRRHGQLFERSRGQLRLDLGAIRLQRGGLRAHVDRLARGVDLQLRVDAHDVADAERDVAAGDRLESAQADGHGVGAARQRGKTVDSGVGRRGDARLVRLRLDDRDGRSGTGASVASVTVPTIEPYSDCAPARGAATERAIRTGGAAGRARWRVKAAGTCMQVSCGSSRSRRAVAARWGGSAEYTNLTVKVNSFTFTYVARVARR